MTVFSCTDLSPCLLPLSTATCRVLEEIVSNNVKVMNSLRQSLYNTVRKLSAENVPTIATALRDWFNTCAVRHCLLVLWTLAMWF